MGYFDDTRFNSIDEMMAAVNDVVERNIRALTQEALPENLGLDRRAAYRLLVTEDAIIVHQNERRNLDYYGGFEYVDSGNISVVGDYVVYSAADDRVCGCLDIYYQRDEQYADEDESDPMDDFNYVGHPAHY